MFFRITNRVLCPATGKDRAEVANQAAAVIHHEPVMVEHTAVVYLLNSVFTSSASFRTSRYSSFSSAVHLNVCSSGGQGRASIKRIWGNSSRKRITAQAAKASNPRAPPAMKSVTPSDMSFVTTASSDAAISFLLYVIVCVVHSDYSPNNILHRRIVILVIYADSFIGFAFYVFDNAQNRNLYYTK